MPNKEWFALYMEDGSEVRCRFEYAHPNRKLASHAETEDGRVIYCRDESRGIFYFEDTEEELFRDRP